MKEKALDVGGKCNNNCIYCKRKGLDKPIEELKKELQSISKESSITLAGGEPTIRKDFFELIWHITNEGYREVKIVSNGRMFSIENFLSEVVKRGVKHFVIKLPAFKEKTYFKICGSTEGLEQTIRGLENIRKFECLLDILIILVEQNEKELEDIVIAVTTLGVNKIIIDAGGVSASKVNERLAKLEYICRQNNVGFELRNLKGERIKKEFTKISLQLPDNIKVNIVPSDAYSYTGADPRIIPASETVKKAREVISYTNFSSIEPLCENLNGIYVYQLNKKSSETLGSLSAQYGKGVNKEQALASGYMELIERYSACMKKEYYEKVIYARYEQICDYAIPLSKFNIIQPLPFYNREGTSMPESYLPSYTDDAWVWAYSLDREKPVLVPAALVYMEFVTRDGKEFTHSKALGLGAGNCVEEAIMHGVNEWIESDSLDSLPRNIPFSYLDKIPVLDLNSVSEMPQDIAKIKDSVFCFYISSANHDFKIHTFIPTIFFKKSEGGMLCISGLASNLNPRLAFNRAVSELIEGCYRSDSCICHRAVANPLCKRENILVKSANYKPKKVVTLDNLKNYSRNSIHQDYLFYRRMLKQNKLEIIIRDLTMEKINIPVIRVLIPGLRTTLLKDQVNFKTDSFGFFVHKDEKSKE